MKGPASNVSRFLPDPGSIVSCLVVAAAVLAVDFVTGEHIQFPIVYIIPVAMASWFGNIRTSYLLAIALPLSRVGMYSWWTENTEAVKLLINAVISSAALAFYCYLVGRTAWQTRELAREVKVLEGILPICSSCRKIRKKDGEYQPLDQYISDHSETRFSHGICPECAKKLYPEFYEKIIGKNRPEEAGTTPGNSKGLDHLREVE